MKVEREQAEEKRRKDLERIQEFQDNVDFDRPGGVLRGAPRPLTKRDLENAQVMSSPVIDAEAKLQDAVAKAGTLDSPVLRVRLPPRPELDCLLRARPAAYGESTGGDIGSEGETPFLLPGEGEANLCTWAASRPAVVPVSDSRGHFQHACTNRAPRHQGWHTASTPSCLS